MRSSTLRISVRRPQAWVAAAVAFHMIGAAACVASAPPPRPELHPTAQALNDFTRRLDGYVELRQALQEKGSTQGSAMSVGQNRASQQVLAARIRGARRAAGQGDIFAPAIAATLRAAMNPEVRGSVAAGTRASIRDDGPAAFVLRVNDAYPNGASLPTVPPNVLRVLPSLPKGLEYRIVSGHLILRDVDADIVVDYLLDVMCARC